MSDVSSSALPEDTDEDEELLWLDVVFRKSDSRYMGSLIRKAGSNATSLNGGC